ncbi:MAG: hypothetical protein JW788_05100, partial [Candidatus Omnitrophica bacterium]|nr:hypothetical protein [Candidatus Omnitrophota bacterium]
MVKPLRKSEIVSVFLLLFCASLFFTWPLALHLKEALPSANEPDAVCVFQLFQAEWTGNVIEGKGDYWNAPFFYPHKGVFAFCEPQALTCSLVWILSKSAGYVLGYNIMILSFLILLGLSGYVSSRLLTSDRLSAFACAFWLSFGTYSAEHICAPALLSIFFPFFSLFFLYLYLLKSKWRFLVLSLVMYFFSWLTYKQGGFYFSILLIPALIFLLLGSQRRPKKVLSILTGFLLVMAILSPFFLSQYDYIKAAGLSPPVAEPKELLSLSGLFHPAYNNWLSRYMPRQEAPTWDLGLTLILVIMISIFLGAFRKLKDEHATKGILKGLILMSVAAL